MIWIVPAICVLLLVYFTSTKRLLRIVREKWPQTWTELGRPTFWGVVGPSAQLFSWLLFALGQKVHVEYDESASRMAALIKLSLLTQLVLFVFLLR